MGPKSNASQPHSDPDQLTTPDCAAVFDAMASAKQQLTVLDWGIANATLEEVFIQLARSMNLDANLH